MVEIYMPIETLFIQSIQPIAQLSHNISSRHGSGGSGGSSGSRDRGGSRGSLSNFDQ